MVTQVFYKYNGKDISQKQNASIPTQPPLGLEPRLHVPFTNGRPATSLTTLTFECWRLNVSIKAVDMFVDRLSCFFSSAVLEC